MCNSEQKEIFRQNFHNVRSEDAVNNLIELYKQLDMPKVYEETYHNIQNEILEDTKKLPGEIIPHELLFNIINILKQMNCTTSYDQ